MIPGREDKPTVALLGDILHRMTRLMRKEIDLARSEMAQNLNRAFVAIGLLVGAVVLAMTALNVLAAAAVAAIAATGIATEWASLIVGGAAALIAIGLVVKGVNDLKISSIAPDRAAQGLRRDAATFKEAFSE